MIDFVQHLIVSLVGKRLLKAYLKVSNSAFKNSIICSLNCCSIFMIGLLVNLVFVKFIG